MSDLKTYIKTHTNDKFRDIFASVNFDTSLLASEFQQNLHPGDLVKPRFDDDLELRLYTVGLIISNTRKDCTILWSV